MKILISVATKRNLHAEMVKWLLSQYQFGVGVDIVNCPQPLEHARNLQVKRFIKSGFECIFFVDSDCVPPLNSVEIINNFNLPILSIPHPTMIGDETGYMVVDKSPNGVGYVQHKDLKGLQKVDAVGCSGLAIKKEVFEKVNNPYFQFVYDTNGELILGEDFDFCNRAQIQGYDIYAYCDRVQRHYVEMML